MKMLKASMYSTTTLLSSAQELARAICPHGRLAIEHLDSRFMITVARHINELFTSRRGGFHNQRRQGL